MADQDIIMFDGSGRASFLHLARWKAKGAAVPLQPAIALAIKGQATDYYRAAWRKAFPDRRALPNEPIATRDGRFTQAMLDVWL